MPSEWSVVFVRRRVRTIWVIRGSRGVPVAIEIIVVNGSVLLPIGFLMILIGACNRSVGMWSCIFVVLVICLVPGWWWRWHWCGLRWLRLVKDLGMVVEGSMFISVGTVSIVPPLIYGVVGGVALSWWWMIPRISVARKWASPKH